MSLQPIQDKSYCMKSRLSFTNKFYDIRYRKALILQHIWEKYNNILNNNMSLQIL